MPPIHFCYFLSENYVSELAGLEATLTVDERDRADRFLRFEDRVHFVLGRAAIRGAFSSEFGIEPSQVRIALSRAGKPYIASPAKQFEFNISHGDGIVIIAWSRSCQVGVDVESIEQSLPVDEISGIAFSESECAILANTSTAKRQETFLRIWVRKEAVIKAEGRGISDELRRFSVAHQSDSGPVWPSMLRYPATKRMWKIEEFLLARKYIVGLAMPALSEGVAFTPNIGQARGELPLCVSASAIISNLSPALA